MGSGIIMGVTGAATGHDRGTRLIGTARPMVAVSAGPLPSVGSSSIFAALHFITQCTRTRSTLDVVFVRPKYRGLSFDFSQASAAKRTNKRIVFAAKRRNLICKVDHWKC